MRSLLRTQDLAYIEQLAARHPDLYTHVVRFELQAGTRQTLIDIGARNSAKILEEAGLGHLPLMRRGMLDAVHIKGEGTAINFGLRSGSVDVFNRAISVFDLFPR